MTELEVFALFRIFYFELLFRAGEPWGNLQKGLPSQIKIASFLSNLN